MSFIAVNWLPWAVQFLKFVLFSLAHEVDEIGKEEARFNILVEHGGSHLWICFCCHRDRGDFFLGLLARWREGDDCVILQREYEARRSRCVEKQRAVLGVVGRLFLFA